MGPVLLERKGKKIYKLKKKCNEELTLLHSKRGVAVGVTERHT